MPYIPQNARGSAAVSPINGAELNYAISKILHDFVLRKGLTYLNLAEAWSAVSLAGAEFQTQVIRPYEDRARKANGPISELDTPERGLVQYSGSPEDPENPAKTAYSPYRDAPVDEAIKRAAAGRNQGHVGGPV